MQKKKNLHSAEKLYKEVSAFRGGMAAIAKKVGVTRQAVYAGLKEGRPSIQLYTATIEWLEQMKELQLRAEEVLQFKK